MNNTDATVLFRRYPENPIITVHDLPYPANSVFNAGAIKIENETLLLMRVEDKKGLSHFTVARSNNGIDQWRIDTLPTLMPEPDTHSEELFGIEDPRITWLEEKKEWFIRFSLSPGKLAMDSESLEIGDAHDEVAVNYEGEPMEIGFNPKYILDFLSVIKTPEIILEMTDCESLAIVRPDGNEHIKFIIMPIRL